MNIMYRVLILASVFLVVAWADDEDMKKYNRVFNPGLYHCCKGAHSPKPHSSDDSAMKECMSLQGGPSCERQICFASKRGFASSDGKIDKAALQELIEKEYADNPEWSKLIMDKCVNGDISKYGEADMCEVMKLMICTGVMFTKSCSEWDNEGPCAGIKELAEELAQKFA